MDKEHERKIKFSCYKHCKKCGKIIENRQKKFCSECAKIVDREKSRIRSQRYREKHGNEKVAKWHKEHPEQRKLHRRDYLQKHKEELKVKLQEWRKDNPEKRAKQNKRAKRRLKYKKHKQIYGMTVYRDTRKKKSAQWKIDHPHANRDWLREKRGIVMAYTCSVCGVLVPYKGIGKVPHRCELCSSIHEANYMKNYNERVKKDKIREPDKFIEFEKRRLGLDKDTRIWTKQRINNLFTRYNRYENYDWRMRNAQIVEEEY